MKKNKILYLSDRDLLTDKKVPTQVLEELKTNGLIAPDMQKVHFCGVISFDDSLAVFFTSQLHQFRYEFRCGWALSSACFNQVL